MQIDIVLLFGVVGSIVGSMFIALLCSLPGFVLDFFTELGAKKHYIFLALAFVRIKTKSFACNRKVLTRETTCNNIYISRKNI